MKNKLLEIKDLNLYYADNHVVKDINLDVEEHDVVAFIGPSGCGKSTVMRTLNRMNDLIDIFKAKGTINFKGRNILDKNEDVYELRKQIGIILQKPSPFSMSIFENVASGMRLNGEKDESVIKQVVEESLKDAGLWDEVKDKLDKPGTSLSGGQQQRLCIARSIAVKPEVLLMDEPTSALDPISTVQIEELVRKLKKDYTIVIVTHNMQQARRIADKTAFFHSGDLVEYAETREIFVNPKEKKTQDYIMGRMV